MNTTHGERQGGMWRGFTQWATLAGVVLCWMALAGCPGFLNRYGLMYYLPLDTGNVWTFGCAADASGINPDVRQDFTITQFRVIKGWCVWTVSQKIYSPQTGEGPPAAERYYVLNCGVVYETMDQAAIDQLPDSLDSAFRGFVHEDLTPRTITDSADPVCRRYQAPVRYRAGALSDFLPFTYTPPAGEGETPTPITINLASFGEGVRDAAAGIALEADEGPAGGPSVWMPKLILGFGIGPLLGFDESGGYATLQHARIGPIEF